MLESVGQVIRPKPGEILWEDGESSDLHLGPAGVGGDGVRSGIEAVADELRGATNLLLRAEAGAVADQDWAVWVDPRIDPR